MARVPADVRLRIRARLGEATDAMGAERSPVLTHRAYRALRGARRIVAATKSKRIRLPAAVAAIAALGLLTILLPGRGPDPIPVPATAAFDLAVQKFDALAQNFVPNAPTESESNSHGAYYAWVMDRAGTQRSLDESADLARAYREAGVPEEVYNFETAGYGLYGGRLDESADGHPITYTAYRGEKGQILSICLHAPEMAAPVGARYWAGTHTLYEYKGHSLALTFHPEGHYISLLVAREPITNLLHDVAAADASAPL